MNCTFSGECPYRHDDGGLCLADNPCEYWRKGTPPIKGEISEKNVLIRHTYRGKRPRRCWSGFDDRIVLYVSPTRHQVQYDARTVRPGRHFPTVSMADFLRWAAKDVTPEAKP